MGKLIKNHWARLIVLTAATYHLAASVEGFFWPKIFWDFLTKNLDGAVKPFPTLQIINLVLSLLSLAWEWPLGPVVKLLPGLHRSMEARLVLYPLVALAAVLMYQSTNAALYYLIGVVVYFWAFCEGETVCAEPWTVPKKTVSTVVSKVYHQHQHQHDGGQQQQFFYPPPPPPPPPPHHQHHNHRLDPSSFP